MDCRHFNFNTLQDIAPDPPARVMKATLHLPPRAFEVLERIGRERGVSTTRAIEMVLAQVVPRLAVGSAKG